MNGEEYLSKKSKSECSAAVVAQWVINNGIDTLGQAEKRVGIITSIICHTFRILPQGTSDNISKGYRTYWLKSSGLNLIPLPSILVPLF